MNLEDLKKEANENLSYAELKELAEHCKDLMETELMRLKNDMENRLKKVNEKMEELEG